MDTAAAGDTDTAPNAAAGVGAGPGDNKVVVVVAVAAVEGTAPAAEDGTRTIPAADGTLDPDGPVGSRQSCSRRAGWSCVSTYW